MKKSILLIMILISFAGYAVEFNSGSKQVHLVELFSSEGCSSCPSAEKWLNQLQGYDGLWKNIIPIEQHVTYWDDLVWFGSRWKDPYALKSLTQRQRHYNSIRGKGVYTPQLIINGRVTKKYNLSNLSKKEVGSLKVKFDESQGLANISFSPIGDYKSLTCEGSIILSGTKSKIKGGENKGKNLTHEFISAGIVNGRAIKEKSLFKCQLKLKNNLSHITSKRKAISVWVRNSSNDIVQAVGGYIN